MIDVAFTRSDLRMADIAVVIDVLRATSTATQALAAGYGRVVFADTIERARALRGPGRVLAGERQCVKPVGFDQGNSPTEAIHRCGHELVLATTNGAPTVVQAAKRAPLVLLGCLLNLRAVLRVLQARLREAELALQIVCSGTDGAVALEDVYVAGRLSAVLPGERTDAALIAESVAATYETPSDALAGSADAIALRAAGLAGDIAYCALESTLDDVGVVIAASPGTAVIAGLTAHTATRSVFNAVDNGATVGV